MTIITYGDAYICNDVIGHWHRFWNFDPFSDHLCWTLNTYHSLRCQVWRKAQIIFISIIISWSTPSQCFIFYFTADQVLHARARPTIFYLGVREPGSVFPFGAQPWRRVAKCATVNWAWSARTLASRYASFASPCQRVSMGGSGFGIIERLIAGPRI